MMNKKSKTNFSSLISVNTIGNKGINEDAIFVAVNENYNVFAVADGLGSYKEATVASSSVMDYLEKNLSKISDSKDDIEQLFLGAQQFLYELSKTEEYASEEPFNLFGTTLILCVESERKITFAYVGNGAILQIRGNLNQFDAMDNPWFSSDLMIPHSIPEKGREALYRLLSNSDDEFLSVPTILSVEKDKLEGDGFIICTDGLYSSDQLKMFRNEGLGLLYTFDKKRSELLELLRKFKNDGDCSGDLLDEILESYLTSPERKFEDDATVGILLTDKFLK